MSGPKAYSEGAVLLDTDVYSYLMKGGKQAAIYRPHIDGKLIALSFITVGELHFGAYRRGWGTDRIEAMKDRLRSVVLVPFDIGVCETYARIKAKLEKKGEPLADNDLWIAACAIRHSIPLVSNNLKHFQRIPDLVLKSEAMAIRFDAASSPGTRRGSKG